MPDDTGSKQRYLVLHDYGMGGLWWWVEARSPREVLERFAEVEIVDAPADIARAEGWNLDVVDIDSPTLPAGLADLRAKRDLQRGRPGFGALADRQIVYLRRPGEDDDPATYLMEVDAHGRRVRQVEVLEDGTAIKSDADDWPFNPPLVDLFDPELADQEIHRDEFDRAWNAAQWADGR